MINQLYEIINIDHGEPLQVSKRGASSINSNKNQMSGRLLRPVTIQT